MHHLAPKTQKREKARQECKVRYGHKKVGILGKTKKAGGGTRKCGDAPTLSLIWI